MGRSSLVQGKLGARYVYLASGILLASGRFAEAREVLAGFARHQNRNPSVPNMAEFQTDTGATTMSSIITPTELSGLSGLFGNTRNTRATFTFCAN